MTATAMFLCLVIAGETPTEHPMAKAKVGDSVTYKMSMPGAPAGAQAMTMKKTVTAKTDDAVTIKIENKVGEMTMPPQEIKINLKEKYDPTANVNAAKGPKAEAKKTGDGTEK